MFFSMYQNIYLMTIWLIFPQPTRNWNSFVQGVPSAHGPGLNWLKFWCSAKLPSAQAEPNKVNPTQVSDHPESPGIISVMQYKHWRENCRWVWGRTFWTFWMTPQIVVMNVYAFVVHIWIKGVGPRHGPWNNQALTSHPFAMSGNGWLRKCIYATFTLIFAVIMSNNLKNWSNGQTNIAFSSSSAATLPYPSVTVCPYMYNLHVKDIKSIERENRLLGLKHVVDNK